MFRSSLLRAVRGRPTLSAANTATRASVLINNKRHAAAGIPTNEDEPPLHRTPDDNKALPGEYPYIGAWLLQEDRQIDPRYPHVITERAAFRNPVGKNYDDECERRNFGDPVHEDDEMFSIYVYDWSQNTSNFQAILQSGAAFSLFALLWTYCSSNSEPLVVGKELPFAESSHKYSKVKLEY